MEKKLVIKVEYFYKKCINGFASQSHDDCAGGVLPNVQIGWKTSMETSCSSQMGLGKKLHLENTL